MPADFDVLLWPVFQEMQRLGADVSLSEYLEAIKSLRTGVGLENAEQLARTCRLLWAKSRDEQEMFDRVFAEKAIPVLMLMPAPVETVGDTLAEADDEMSQDEVQERTTEAEPQEGDLKDIATLSPPPSCPFLRAMPIPQKHYHFTQRLPLSKSEMSSHWQHLRSFRSAGPLVEFDIEQTIKEICHYGIFRGPVMRAKPENITKLLLLIDERGSMRPFRLLIEALKESAKHNSTAKHMEMYYFHNCPGQVLYEDERLGRPVVVKDVFTQSAGRNCVLIVSDAGAARAYYNDTRIEATQNFLREVAKFTYLYAWLNPVPAYRWRHTTAEDIQRLAPMYQMDSHGFADALAILQGEPFPSEVKLHV